MWKHLELKIILGLALASWLAAVTFHTDTPPADDPDVQQEGAQDAELHLLRNAPAHDVKVCAITCAAPSALNRSWDGGVWVDAGLTPVACANTDVYSEIEISTEDTTGFRLCGPGANTSNYTTVCQKICKTNCEGRNWWKSEVTNKSGVTRARNATCVGKLDGGVPVIVRQSE